MSGWSKAATCQSGPNRPDTQRYSQLHEIDAHGAKVPAG